MNDRGHLYDHFNEFGHGAVFGAPNTSLSMCMALILKLRFELGDVFVLTISFCITTSET